MEIQKVTAKELKTKWPSWCYTAHLENGETQVVRKKSARKYKYAFFAEYETKQKWFFSSKADTPNDLVTYWPKETFIQAFVVEIQPTILKGE